MRCFVVLAFVVVGAGCDEGTRFPCCKNGVTETCVCPPNTDCVFQPFSDCGDGRCVASEDEADCDDGE